MNVIEIYATVFFLYLTYAGFKLLEAYVYFPKLLFRRFFDNESVVSVLAGVLISPYVICLGLFCFAAVRGHQIGVANWVLVFHFLFAFFLFWLKDKLDDRKEAEERKRAAIRGGEVYIQYLSDPTLLNEKPFRDEFRKYWNWKDVRQMAINKWQRESDGTCGSCGKKLDAYFDEIHVDHIRPKSLYRHLSYHLPNLQILCRSCNIYKSDYDGPDWKDQVQRRVDKKSALKKLTKS